jgi:DNA repair protein RadC
MQSKPDKPIKDLPAVDRPREKLIARGPGALYLKELVAILLGSGTRGQSALGLAQTLVEGRGRASLSSITPQELLRVPGVGPAKAARLVAAVELGRRLLMPERGGAAVKSPRDVYELTRGDFAGARKEKFLALYLDTAHRIVHSELVSLGTLDSSLVHPREVFHPAVERTAAAVVVVHNHPSGETRPSQEDIELTRRLLDAGRIMGIELLDHVIVTSTAFFSLKEGGLL